MPERILAIDVGRDVGWATGSLGDPAPGQWGTIRLPGTSVRDIVGARMDQLDEWLAESMHAWGTSVVVLAERFRARTMREASASLALDGLVRMHAYRRECRMLCQPENTVRKEMLGRGSGKSDEMKRLAINWCHNHSLEVGNDHEADACVMWVWANRELLKTVIQPITSERSRDRRRSPAGP